MRITYVQVWLTAGPKTFASDEGIPIGKGATRWVVMSRHFYNPTQKAGVPDYGTGYRVIYTPTLRPKVWRRVELRVLVCTPPHRLSVNVWQEIGQILIGTSSIHVPAKSYMHRVCFRALVCYICGTESFFYIYANTPRLQQKTMRSCIGIFAQTHGYNYLCRCERSADPRAQNA